MNTHPITDQTQDQLAVTRWRLDPSASSAKFQVPPARQAPALAAFFDTQNHPEVRFRSTSVSDAGEDKLRVEGELEVAGERVPLQLEPTIHHTDRQLDIEAHHRRPASAWLTWSPLEMTMTPATLTVHARLRRES